MTSSLVQIPVEVAPLYDELETCSEKVVKRTRRAADEVNSHGLWVEQHDAALSPIKNQISSAVKPGYLRDGHEACSYTDVSDKHSAAVFTLIKNGNLVGDVAKPEHEPLALLYGTFRGPIECWSFVETEALSIIEATTK